MPLPIERLGYDIADDGAITFQDRTLSWEEADKRAGRRLDRRRTWAFIDGGLCGVAQWTRHCSGCTDTPEYTSPPDRGMGCDECGYTGRRRQSSYVPWSCMTINVD